MNSKDHIIKQLEKEGIEFELIQSEYDPSNESELSKLIHKWKKKFIHDLTAPNLDHHLWHIFSFRATPSLEGEKATAELKNQYKTDTYLFNESQQYLIKCFNSIPLLVMDDFSDDIYLSHHNLKWTYVLTHESPDIGPFFSN